MIDSNLQRAKAERLRELHHKGMLVLPNIWDPLGAALLQDLGYPAVATASAAVAWTNGYDDGENIPFKDLVSLLRKIAATVSVPVTADIESGYADTNAVLRENIQSIIQAGIVGINFEDTEPKSNALLPIDLQCERIELIRATSKSLGIPLFINARTDVYLKANDFESDAHRFEETLKRGKAYMSAGADCLFPAAIRDKQDIQNLIASLQCPVNVLTIPGIPDLKTLAAIGVARVSVGPSFLKIATQAMRDFAIKLKEMQGLDEIATNKITSDYLRKLIGKG